MNKSHRISLFLLIVLNICGLVSILTPIHEYIEEIPVNDNSYNIQLEKAGNWNLLEIFIDDTDPNFNWSETVKNFWCSGSGTSVDPYLIENVTINQEGSGSCIEIRNSDKFFILKNCSLYNAGISAIECDNVDNGVITNNTCFSSTRGITLRSSFNNNITQNIVYECEYDGIYIYYSDSNNLFDNNITNCIDGITFKNSDNANLSGNLMYGCGVSIIDDHTPFFIDTSNKVNDKVLYYYYHDDNLTPLNYSNPGQIILVSCENASISDFEISDVSKGIYLVFCDNTSISDVNLTNNKVGIVMETCHYSNITRCDISINQDGIILKGNNNRIINNSLNHNEDWGIYTYGSYNYLNENTIKNSQTGFFLIGNNNTFTNLEHLDLYMKDSDLYQN